MTSSGTFAFSLSDSSIVVEAFSRLGIQPPELTREHLIQARVSLNLELVRWSNKTVLLFKVVTGTINLVAGQANYNLPTNLITITEVVYSTPNGNGTGLPLNRFMTPLTRTEYVMLPNPLQQGIPTAYWFQRLPTPILTLWQTPSQGAPTYVVNWWGLQRVQDADYAGGQTPDIVYRAYDALCACLAARLATKYRPDMEGIRKAEATEAFNDFVSQDQEDGPLILAPNIGVYARLGR